eukprot:sb/3471350/
MYTADDELIGGVTVRFTSPMKYSIGHCTEDLDPLPVHPGDEVKKIWIIRKTNTTLSIECNGVEVLNYQFSDSNETDCETRWEEDVMKIIFTQYDTASDGYEEKPTKVFSSILLATTRGGAHAKQAVRPERGGEIFRNRPNQDIILVPDWLITSHVPLHISGECCSTYRTAQKKTKGTLALISPRI